MDNSIKNMLAKMYVSRNTMDIIRLGEPHAFALWNAKDITSNGNKLQFTVNNENYNGEVLVTYNSTSKDYFISFYNIVNNRKKIINKFKNIKEKNLYNKLKEVLGRIEL
jgi:hypothetical protein